MIDRHRMGRPSRAPCVVIFLLAICGCAPTLHDSPFALTERTREVLARQSLMLNVDSHPPSSQAALPVLFDRHQRQATLETCFAIAELSLLAGREQREESPQAAQQLFFQAAAFAFEYLFDPRYDAERNEYDPQFAIARDIYNQSLLDYLRIAESLKLLRPGQRLEFRLAGDRAYSGEVVVRGGGRFDTVEKFEFAADYEVTGANTQHLTYGLGAPMIAIHSESQSELERGASAQRMSTPITAILNFDLRPKHQDGHQQVTTFRLELINPFEVNTVQAVHRTVPLESDLTTPLARMLSIAKQESTPTSEAPTLLSLDGGLRNIFMLRPYDPGKIPVLLVHGVDSNPLAWMNTLNELRAAETVSDRFQFWLYVYPNDAPFWVNAAGLRDDLHELRADIDPGRRNPTLDQIVLVGHGVGGLIAQLQTIDSGNAFWTPLSDREFAELNAGPDVKAFLARGLFFQANPSIRRVVTIAAPLQGYHQTNAATSYLNRQVLRYTKAFTPSRLEADNPGFFKTSALKAIYTNTDATSPDSPLLPPLRQAMAAQPLPRHNIVGDAEDQGGPFWQLDREQNDGLVSFESAHDETARSELVVNATHDRLLHHPRTVLELRRILLHHLAETNQLARPDNSPAPANPR